VSMRPKRRVHAALSKPLVYLYLRAVALLYVVYVYCISITKSVPFLFHYISGVEGNGEATHTLLNRCRLVEIFSNIYVSMDKSWSSALSLTKLPPPVLPSSVGYISSSWQLTACQPGHQKSSFATVCRHSYEAVGHWQPMKQDC